MSSNLKELSLHNNVGIFLVEDCLVEWENANYIPRKLNVIYNRYSYIFSLYFSILISLRSSVPKLRLQRILGSDNIVLFNISFELPSPVVPLIQLQVTNSSVDIPSVETSSYGILGLDEGKVGWMLNIGDCRNTVAPMLSGDWTVLQQRLADMFQNYTCLKALEVRGANTVGVRNDLSDNEPSLISYFLSIISYRLCNLPSNDCSNTLKQIFNCKVFVPM